MGPNFFDPKLTRLACLLSFGSFFSEGQKRFKEWCVDCQPATCNHLGDACWCGRGSRQRGRRSANETAEEVKDDGEFDFVEGEPQDWEIDCDRSEDCPHLWYCAEKVTAGTWCNFQFSLSSDLCSALYSSDHFSICCMEKSLSASHKRNWVKKLISKKLS